MPTGGSSAARPANSTQTAPRMISSAAKLPTPGMISVGQEKPPAPPEERRAVAPRNAFRLVAPGSKAEFFLHPEGDTLIGRGDPVTGITPDVDLAALDPQRSTSRRHAKIYPMGGKLYLMEEIGVMNGTFVNGSRVATGTPVPVVGGDELRFGLVPLTLETAAGT